MPINTESPISDQSIAVLPFINRSQETDGEYFSDGITEEIINTLSKDKGLKVIARTSSFAYKGKQVDVREIAHQLRVATLVEGSVRKAGQRVRISVQLIETAEGTQLWSKNFDREINDIFAVQDELSTLIADQIREQFGHFEMADTPTIKPTSQIDAYERFLKGSFHFKRKDLADIQLAEGYFKAAIVADERYAEAHAFLAETYLHLAGFGVMTATEAHEQARQAAQRAIQIRKSTARAHKVLAYVHLFFDWDWPATRKAYEAALRAGLTGDNEFITYYYVFLEKAYDQAIAIARQGVERDPLHSITHWQLGLCCYFAEKFPDAIKAFERAILLDDQFAEAHRWRGLALAKYGQFAEALASVKHAIKLTQGQGPANFNLLQVRAMMGERESVIADIKATNYLDPCDPAELYALLELPDKAIDYLELAFEQRSTMMVSLKHYWVWDGLRGHPRFERLYNRMKFSSSGQEQTTGAVWSPTTKPAKKALLSDQECQEYLLLLTRAVEDQEAYLNAELTLRSLAADLKLHPNKLSWLINASVGKNFNEYINTYRLEAFKRKALSPANSHLTLLGLAYESGFNSKTVFNNFFKKQEGTTPRAWLKSQMP